MLNVLAGHRVVPVCTLRSPVEAENLGRALLAGGLPVVEVTLRTRDALEGLAAMARIDGLVVGAGTIRTPEQLRAAQDAGAVFAVSPCMTDALADAALEARLPFVPGTATATEVQYAVDAGFDAVKFFPAEANGGIAALRALAEVFPDVCFLPTGGITQEGSADYLAHPQVLAVGGSWMLPRDAREAGDWDAVTRAVRACATPVRT